MTSSIKAFLLAATAVVVITSWAGFWASPCNTSLDPIGCQIVWETEAMNR